MNSHVPDQSQRRILVVTHTGRAAAGEVASAFIRRIRSAGIHTRVLDEEAAHLEQYGIGDDVETCPADEQAAIDCELVVVFGGDGTILRGTELARYAETPLLGVNLGHVGFLAESDVDDLDITVENVVGRKYTVEERLSLDVDVSVDGAVVWSTWALNEAAVEKAARERMLEVVAGVDGLPLSRWGCDGVVCATPTGSTAYSFSAGGPIVWPDVEALVMVPISAHALFARPMVVSPDSTLAIEVIAGTLGSGVLWCDGRRTFELPPGARVEVRRGRHPVRLARLHHATFTDRLVRKFELPVSGWRGRRAREMS